MPADTFDLLDRRVADGRQRGDDQATGDALLERATVRLAEARLDEALGDLDESADRLRAAGDDHGAAVAASAGSVVARVQGDVPGAVGRAMFARGWAPGGSAAAVVAQLAVAEAALDAGDLGTGLWAYLEATNVLGEAQLPQNMRQRFAAYADWLNADDHDQRRPRTPALGDAAPAPQVARAIADALARIVPVEVLDNRRKELPPNDLGRVAAGFASGVLHTGQGELAEASAAFADAALLGQER